MILRLIAGLYVLGLLTLGLVACITMADPASLPGKVDQSIGQIQNLIEQGNYLQAKEESERYLQNHAAHPFALEVKFYRARALQGLGQCSEAVGLYRGVAVGAHERNPRIEVQALYEMAFCLEALGESEQAIAVLMDLRQRQNWLSPQIAKAEIPARLATEYAVVGNKEEALRYFQEAELAMKGLVTATNEKAPTWLPRTLYYMGYIPLPGEGAERSADQLLLLLESNQRHLVKSVELGDPTWSDNAADILIRTYGRLLEEVRKGGEDKQEPDRALAERRAQEHRWSTAHSILRSTHNLKLLRLPREAGVSAAAEKVDRFVEDLEKQLASVLAEPPVATRLTPEATLREGLRRSGRVISDETILERAAEKDSQLPAKEDPNL